MSNERKPPTPKTPSTPKSDRGSKVQGEGNYDAARRFRKDEEEFVRSGQVEDAARRAEPKTRKEADELKRAEHEGRSPARR